jgi:hypothetical protein
VTARRSLDLRFALDGPGVPPAARVQYRAAGGGNYQPVPLERSTEGWVATIAADAVQSPGLDYFVEAGMPPRLVFASAQKPHRVQVLTAPEDAQLDADLVFYRLRRSRVDTSFEMVDFGRREEGADYYLRSELAYSYRILGIVHYIKLGFGLIRGEAPVATRDGDPDQSDRGMYYGFAEVRLRIHPVFHVDGRPILGATKQGFDGGVALAAHIGYLTGTQVTLGMEYLGKIGRDGYFRLGWRTVPRFPMGITIELSNLLQQAERPAGHSTALRAVYDVSCALAEWLALTLRLGYEARDSHFGGATGGLAASFGF